MVKAVAIITVSDSCFKDNSKDSSGPTIFSFIQTAFPEANIHLIRVPDEKEIIERELKYFCDSKVELILTTGGTGLSPRDVTPEATKAVIQKEVPAITTAMTIESLKNTPMAILSRAVAGIRDRTLIINFPGSQKAVTECIQVVKPVLSHAISLIKNELVEVTTVHDKMQSPLKHSCPHEIESQVDVTKVALRPRKSPFPMIEVSEAFNIVDAVMLNWKEKIEVVPIEDTVGRVVAQDIIAVEPMPPFPTSVKDGYACISHDGAGIRVVRAALAAGDTPFMPLVPVECARINTGAPLPLGADCVVQVEDTKLINATEDGVSELLVEMLIAPRPNQDIRPIGFDIPVGTPLVKKGDVIDAAQVAVLAGAGRQSIPVFAYPKIAIMSTGNELQNHTDEILEPSHIRDTNRIMLKLLLKEHGYESIDCGIARDEPDELGVALRLALLRADVLVCTGGVSMGDRDLLKPILTHDFGATIHFGRVRMKPGKPCTFATCEFDGKTKYIFGLPGNPVSAYVCCLVLVVRALQRCTRLPGGFPRMGVQLQHDVQLDVRPEYARAVLAFPAPDAPPVATVLGTQCSSRLQSACGTSVLLELPARSTAAARLAAGTVVPALLAGRVDVARL